MLLDVSGSKPVLLQYTAQDALFPSLTLVVRLEQNLCHTSSLPLRIVKNNPLCKNRLTLHADWCLCVGGGDK